MIITILDGHVDPGKFQDFQDSFAKGVASIPSQILHSFLLQDSSDPTHWQINTVWKSREALNEYRSSVDTPEGVVMFRSVGTEPILTIYSVPMHTSQS